MTLSPSDAQHDNALPYAVCRILFTIMVSVEMLDVVMLSVVAPPDSGKTPWSINYSCKMFNSSGPYTLPPPP
jgi:hypothetical protein